MSMNVNNYGTFIYKMESLLPGNIDGRLTQEELQQGYDQLLKDDPNAIPVALARRFQNGQQLADEFNKLDPLGLADGYVDEYAFQFAYGDSDSYGPGNSGSVLGWHPTKRPLNAEANPAQGGSDG